MEHEHFVGDLDVPHPVLIDQGVELRHNRFNTPEPIAVRTGLQPQLSLAALKRRLNTTVMNAHELCKVIIVRRTLEVVDGEVARQLRDFCNRFIVRAVALREHFLLVVVFPRLTISFCLLIAGIAEADQVARVVVELIVINVVDGECVLRPTVLAGVSIALEDAPPKAGGIGRRIGAGDTTPPERISFPAQGIFVRQSPCPCFLGNYPPSFVRPHKGDNLSGGDTFP